jgi:hypothetical protein
MSKYVGLFTDNGTSCNDKYLLHMLRLANEDVIYWILFKKLLNVLVNEFEIHLRMLTIIIQCYH